MKKLMLLIFVPSTIFLGCSKKEKMETPPINYQNTDFMPLQVGNYWVYDTYKIDTLGNESVYSQSDSVYVSRDTIISGKTYYILVGNNIGLIATGNILRNESNNVFDKEEKIVFTTNNIGNVFRMDTVPTIYVSSTWINTPNLNIIVDAGSFLCYDKKTEIVPLVSNYPWGTRSIHKYYSNDVGVIKSQFHFFSAPELYELRLISYQVN